MALDEKSVRRRLGFIRYLYHRAAEQSRQPHPLDTISVLMFHDAVELFMHLALEHHDPARATSVKQRVQFMDYFNLLPALKGRTPIERLNTARVGFKHSGVPPSTEPVSEFPIVTLN